MTTTAVDYTQEYVPENLFGKDHFSTLAYAEHLMVEVKGFQVGYDARMRHNRRNYRVMQAECPRPRRLSHVSALGAGPIPMDKYGSRLKDGTEVFGHDDWSCIQDMANAGYFTYTKGNMKHPKPATAADIEPKVTLHLSERGQAVAAALRKHKANGGSFGNFDPFNS